MHKFWSWIRDDGGGRVLRLDGPIDEESIWSDGVTPKEFRSELYAEDGDVTIWINSPGGNVFAAAEVYTMIRDYPGKVTVKIDAIAASAASVVAMAGDRVLMSPVAMLMVHDPMTIAMGNSRAMEKAISSLNEVKESLVNAYVAKTGLSRNKIAKMMSDETWINARKAVELGFADEIMFADRKAETKTEADPNEEENGDGDGDDDTPEEEKKKDGGIHLDARPLAEALEGVLFSTRVMGQTILNQIGAIAGEEDDTNLDEGEATPAAEKPEGEATSAAEDPAAQEEPVNPEEHETMPPEAHGEGSEDSTDSNGEAGHAADDEAVAEAGNLETTETRDTLPDGFIAINMDGRTRDGSVPYIILKNQLDRMR